MGIAIDTSWNAYITGQTRSSDFPMFSAIYGSLGGTSDAFVAKINNSGSIVYSTFLGDWLRSGVENCSGQFGKMHMLPD